jgi:hypothetical protein
MVCECAPTWRLSEFAGETMEYGTDCGRKIQPGMASGDHPPGPSRDASPRLGASWWATMTVAALLLAIGGMGITRFVLRSSAASQVPFIGNKTPASSPSASTRQPSAQPSAPALLTEQMAAQSLSQLLAQSASDRTAIDNAFSDVTACGSGLARDAQAFRQAAVSREQLLSQLSTLPGRSVLPAQMLRDLSGAWQASYRADQDYASWADDEKSKGCTSGDTSDSYYRAATEPDYQATTDKEAFVNAWNTIASHYGLTTYQQDQL